MELKKESKPNPRILVVDDDADVVEVMSKLLELNGYKPLRATDGKAGLEQVRNQTVDLVLLDLMMPGMDGFEMLEMLQKQTGTKGIPVIVLSARGEKEAVLRALQGGAVDFVHKGADPDEVLARVQVHLMLHKRHEKAMHEYGEHLRRELAQKSAGF
ncbi:MAG: response regulator [Candidatus Wallbacteria bacterium]|nr:response regulator [Candidatus Wallbacteria bacterium]